MTADVDLKFVKHGINHERTDRLLFNPPRFLLNEEQAKWLAIARFAGEPFGLYPMWVPEAECAPCRWSQGHSDPAVFQSLLAVASIEMWPVSPQEREHWSELKRTQSRYCLTVPARYPVRQLWPPLDRLLAACIVAVHEDGLSWIGANRILKLRLDAHVSPGLLALMVSLGALQAPAQWQMFHPAGPNLEALIERLSKHLHASGVLDWNTPVGQDVIADLMGARDNPRAGWVEASVVEELIAAATRRHRRGRGRTISSRGQDSRDRGLLRNRHRQHLPRVAFSSHVTDFGGEEVAGAWLNSERGLVAGVAPCLLERILSAI